MSIVVGIAFVLSATASGGADGKSAPSDPALGPDLAGYTVVSSGPVPNPSGKQSHAEVMCPSGTVALGGGGIGDSQSLLQSMNSSFPIGSNGIATGWRVDMNNLSGSDLTFKVYAVCAKKPKSYAIAVGADFSNPPGSQTAGAAFCPRAPNGKLMKVFAGGVAGSFSRYQSINSSFPAIRPYSWHVRMNNLGGLDAPFSVVAMCRLSKGWKLAVGPLVVNPAGEQTAVRVSCPAGLVAVGGGVYSDTPSVNVNVNTTWPDTGSSWKSYENNSSSNPHLIRPYVVCLK